MDQNQEEFDQKRFLAAMVLSGIVLVVWQVFFAPPPPPPPEDVSRTATQTAGQLADATGDTAPSDAGDHAADTAPPVKLDQAALEASEEHPVLTHELRTEHVRIVLSTRGARVIEAEVLEPKQYNAEGDLLKLFPEDSTYFPFGIAFTKNSIALRRGLVWEFVESESTKKGDTYTKVTYRHSDPGGRFEIDKVIAIASKGGRYQFDLDVVVRNKLQRGPIVDKLALDVTGYKDPENESSFLDMYPDEVEGICKLDGDIERELFTSIDNPLAFNEPTRWGAINSRYFIFAAVPSEMGEKCLMEPVEESYLRTRIVQPEFTVQPGATYSAKYNLFIGPKDYDVLEATGAKLEDAVDFGILTFLARPLRWTLVKFYGWVGNWGLAIILLTLLIRILMLPIMHKVYKNSEKMKELQPALAELKEKYKDDQQRQAEETMKVWKEHGVSPLGCLPMFLQFPILLALYFMILNSVELYHADFALWYTDLSSPDPYFVLPVLMGVVMFVQQSFMTIDTPNPQMATMMKIMPVMFTVFMLFLPSGVVLYYFVSLVLGLAQQFYIKRSFRSDAAATA